VVNLGAEMCSGCEAGSHLRPIDFCRERDLGAEVGEVVGDLARARASFERCQGYMGTSPIRNSHSPTVGS